MWRPISTHCCRSGSELEPGVALPANGNPLLLPQNNRIIASQKVGRLQTTKLDTTDVNMPVIFLNHYPIDNQMDNWYEVTELFKTRNTILFLCGHGHANKVLNFEDIPGIMGRSNLRAKQPEGGYNVVDVRADSIFFTERKPVSGNMKSWAGIQVEQHHYDINKKFTRPDYTVNTQYAQVKEKWLFSSDANVISTPAVTNGLVIFGNQQGGVSALSLKNGKEILELIEKNKKKIVDVLPLFLEEVILDERS